MPAACKLCVPEDLATEDVDSMDAAEHCGSYGFIAEHQRGTSATPTACSALSSAKTNEEEKPAQGYKAVLHRPT